ncbi:MAG: hypothetical protein IANPNBLG_03519 [Bryobacteraceae bacterium]|nr:hypothetical protein [Bryobacteraceae bacterium]
MIVKTGERYPPCVAKRIGSRLEEIPMNAHCNSLASLSSDEKALIALFGGWLDSKRRRQVILSRSAAFTLKYFINGYNGKC